MRSIALVLLVACGAPAPDTHAVAQAATACGLGTHVDGATCVLDAARYAILAPTKIAADATRTKVVVVGTKADGTPADDDLVISTDRAAAGTLSRTNATLTRLGATTYFTACDIHEAGCLGPFAITVARASEPAVAIARLDATLVDPIEVNPAAACLGTGASVAHLAGNDANLAGTLDLVGGAWTTADLNNPGTDVFSLAVVPTVGDTWTFDFDALALGPIVIGKLYDEVQISTSPTRSDELGNFRAAMRVQHSYLCSTVTGRFRVMDFTTDSVAGSYVVSTFTAWFEQHCNGDLTTAVTGCVHYQR